MKLVDLEHLGYYHRKLMFLINGIIADIDDIRVHGVTISPELIDKESITLDKLDKELQDLLEKLKGTLTAEELEAMRKDLEDKLAELEAILNGDKDALEEALKQSGTNAQAIANAVTNINNVNDAVQKLKEDTDASVDILNTAMVSTQTALEGLQSEITGVKRDVEALDGLSEMEEKIKSIQDIVDALEKNDLTAYVKKTELDDGVVTTMVKYNVLKDGSKDVNFYTKEEFPDKVTEQLGEYVTNGDLESYKFYDEEKTAEKVKEMMLNGEGDSLNQNLMEKTAEFVQSQLTTYVDGKLTDYSTVAQTSKAITDIVGNIDIAEDGTIAAQLSTINQTAAAVETSLTTIQNDLVDKYFDEEKTAAYVNKTLVDNHITDGEGGLNVYTKSETPSAVETTLYAKKLLEKDGDTYITNVYTKKETDDMYARTLSKYDAEGNAIEYSTLQQTSDAIIAQLAKSGLTDIEGAKLSVTPEEVATAVTKILEDGETDLASTSYVDQTAESIGLMVSEYKTSADADAKNLETKYSALALKADGLELRVAENNIDGDQIKSRINMSNETVTIDGKYLHVTGKTVFDDDVKIKGVIDTDKGLTINDGSVQINGNGMRINTESGGSLRLNKEGMNFFDSKNQMFASIGRFAAGTCSHGETITLNWDVAPKAVLLSPYSAQITTTQYSDANIYLKCFASDITKAGFKCNCYTTTGGTAYTKKTIAAKATTANTRTATDTADVPKTLTSATLTTPATSTQTTMSGTIEFDAGYVEKADADVTATNANVLGLAGTTLTVTATPKTGYKVTAVTITDDTGAANAANKYTATLGAHANADVVMTTSGSPKWNQAGIREAYIDIYVGDTVYKTLTAYKGTSAYGRLIPSTTNFTYTLNEIVKHAAGASVHIQSRAVYTYKSPTYGISQSAITCTSNVTGENVISSGSANYIALG